MEEENAMNTPLSSRRYTRTARAVSVFLLCATLSTLVAFSGNRVADAAELPACTAGYKAPPPPSIGAEIQQPDAITYYQNADGTPCEPTTQQRTESGEVPAKKTDCSGILTTITNPFTCAFRHVIGLVATTLIYISAWVLTVAGMLFNFLVQYTVVEFGAVYGMVKPGVEAGWTAFRDIANIVIIGMFTFIAISIILGVERFGQKKFIANVLIVAILINFSLLFGKLIVDASNFTALKLYQAAGLSTESKGTLSGYYDPLAKAQTGIAGQFIYFMGVNSFSDSYAAVQKSAAENDSGWIALLHSIASSAMLLMAAAIFLYGCFLLATRAILIIFLLLTSAISFAAYLIPGTESSSYGWKKWWGSIVNTAIFAPLLMALLWATLVIASGVKKSTGILGIPPETATLGTLISDPTQPGGIGAFFIYILVIGLLYTCFRIAHDFASSIQRFDTAGNFVGGALTLGSRFLAAPLLRQGAGWLGSRYQKRQAGEAVALRDLQARALLKAEDAGKRGLTVRQRGFQNLAERYNVAALEKETRANIGKKIAESKMNVMDTRLMQKVAEKAGLTGIATGASTKSTKSYADQIKARAEAAEKRAAKLAPTAEQNEKARQGARAEVYAQRKIAEDQLKVTRETQKSLAEATKQFEQLPQQLATAQQRLQSERDSATANKMAIENRLKAGVITEQEHAVQMRAENERIIKAQGALNPILERIKVIDEPVTEAEKMLKEHQSETARLQDEAAKKIVAAMGDAGEALAEKLGEKEGDILSRALGSFTGANAEIGKQTRDLYKKKIRTAGLRDVFAQLQSESTPASPPQSPPKNNP
jgi:hypothetical protein